MALFSRKDKTAEIVKGVVEELAKSPTIASMLQSGQVPGNTVQQVPPMAQKIVASRPLPRPADQFGSTFGPGAPLYPGAIDPVNPITGRAEPRITQYQVAENLQIGQEPAPFRQLEWTARNVDIIARCLTIRIDDICKMDWSFTVSDKAIDEIMATENCSHAKASTIARQKYGDQISKMTDFWRDPFPLANKTWRSWIAEAFWNYLVFDEVVVYPNFTLGGECFGFDLIDPSTIKILRDDKGRVPRYPFPAFQQILFGFPRGEFTASPLNHVDGQFASPDQFGPIRPSDSLSVFIGHPQTKYLYGFSAVEQCLPFADLWLNRQEWLISEYKAGSVPMMFLETDSALELWQMADNDRILNDYYSGQTANRQQIRSLPAGAKAVQTVQVDEKFKPEYDEFIKKHIAAIMGVAPSQVGVVARAGLGGGKGAADGEAQSAESVSTKPAVLFVEDMINSLCVQYMKMDDSITFHLADDTSSTDQMNKFKSYSEALNSGELTLNDVRGEIGMPLFDMPEADEPYILTSKGPVFLRGQLEVDTQGETTGQTGVSSDNPSQNSQSQNSQSNKPQDKGDEANTDEGKASQADLKANEEKAFRKFASKPRSRDFTFEHHSPEEAELLKATITDTPKGLVTKSGESHEDKITRLAHKHRHSIQVALAGSVVGIAKAIEHAFASSHLDPPVAARQAVDAYINFNSDQSVAALKSLYTLAMDAGAADTTSAIGADAILNPLNQQLINRAGYTIKGINDTTQNRIYTAIRDGIHSGASSQSTAQVIDAIVNDGARAQIIAETETNRGYLMASQQISLVNGATGFNWNTDDDPCPECQDLQDSNPHDISEALPPDHPSCKCGVTYIYPSESSSTGD